MLWSDYISRITPLANFVTRRLLARLLSTLICSILIIARPFSRFGGPLAFLALTIKELVFSVQEDLAQQLETTILNLMGGFAGIGLSTIANFLSSLTRDNSTLSRIIPALALVAICFLAGWLRSLLPRLAPSSRIACFIAVWMLTAEADTRKSVKSDVIQFLWIILTAAVTSLFSGMLLLRWSSPQFAEDIATAMSKLRECLLYNLTAVCSDSAHSFPLSTHDDLMARSIALNITYRQAVFELRIGRVPVKSIKPLIMTVEHLRRELFCGSSFPRSHHSSSPLEVDVIEALRLPTSALGNAVLLSMSAVENTVLAAFHHSSVSRSLERENAALGVAAARLSDALAAIQSELYNICEKLDEEERRNNGQTGFPQNILDICLFLTSLLQMAQEMQHAITSLKTVVTIYETSSARLWYPRLSWLWLGIQPTTVVLEERVALQDDEEVVSQFALSAEETFQGLSEYNHVSSRDDKGMVNRQASLSLMKYNIWHHPLMLRFRLSLSRSFRSLQHSPHLQYAVKNAAGVALLSIPAFLPADYSGHRWFVSVHGQWMITSYVWVLETNAGATWRVGYLRLTGTVIGAVYAYIGQLICQMNPYALVTLVTIPEIFISWIVINTTFPSLGTVASITLPALMLAPYVSPDIGSPIWELALLRGSMISLGIVAALTMNSLIFPRYCRVMFLNGTSRTLGILNQLYMNLSRDLFQHMQPSTNPDLRKHQLLKLELNIRNALDRMSTLIITMNDELSLVPKPMQRYRQVVRTLQKLLDLMAGLRKIRENIPLQETVNDLSKQRREFMSCVCLTLFTCEQVFRARQPLPQFLPSMRVALLEWERCISEHLRHSRLNGTAGLPQIYALAEVNILNSVVDTMDKLTDATRRLFGTAEWFDLPLDLTLMMSTQPNRVRGPDEVKVAIGGHV